jgi:hypothetical protein
MGWGFDEECVDLFDRDIIVTPGKIRDKPINTYAEMTIRFKLN